MRGKRVLYNGQVLTLTKYCIYLNDLSEREKCLIVDLDGNKIDIDFELEQMDT